jgi:ABC-2 type transport system ATP-binding protein
VNAPAAGAAIRTQGLARSFGALPAVGSLDLAVARGEMYGLVGPDGAGKSTAIRLLCGLLKPNGGSGQVLGFDLVSQADRIKARIGYLSQNFTLYGDLTVDENIEFFADLHGVAGWRARREELLDFTRLAPFRRRLAGALSGGMKKKLALACTLIHTPDLILLDEPSTGVDPVSRGEFWQILSSLLDQGVTIFMTTPYLDEAERCHRVSLMHRGRVFMTGTPAQIRAALPGRVYRIDSPDPVSSYRALRARWSSTHLALFGDHVHFWAPGGEADARESVARLESAALGPARYSPSEPSLEDAFVALLSDPDAEDSTAAAASAQACVPATTQEIPR